MKARTAAIAVALIAVVGAGACTKEMKAEIARDKQINKDMAAVTAGGVPGVVVVIRDGGNKTRIPTGVGNVASNTPMKVNDQVRIGSVSKTYVSVVVLQLVAEGKLALDDKVQHHLPGIVPNASKISVRQLLNHSSGIPNYEEHPGYLAALTSDPDHVWSPRQLVDMSVSMGSRFEPGTSADWSPTPSPVAATRSPWPTTWTRTPCSLPPRPQPRPCSSTPSVAPSSPDIPPGVPAELAGTRSRRAVSRRRGSGGRSGRP